MNRQEIERGIQEMTVRELTMAKLKRAGLPIPPRPADTGRDIFTEWENLKARWGGVANIPFAELGDFLDRWSGMVAYARWVEAVADIDASTAREIRDTVKKQLYLLQEGNRENRDAAVYAEPLFIEWQNKYIEADTMYKTVKGLREGYEYRLNSISREITRRGSDVTNTQLAANRGNVS